MFDALAEAHAHISLVSVTLTGDIDLSFHCSLTAEQTAPRVSEKTSLSLGYFQLEAAAGWRLEEKIKEGQGMHVVLY